MTPLDCVLVARMREGEHPGLCALGEEARIDIAVSSDG